jgi:hypothetical protein
MKICQSKIKDDTHSIASSAKRGRIELDHAVEEVALSVSNLFKSSDMLLERYVIDRLKDALIESSARRI